MVKAGPSIIFASPGYLGAEVAALDARTDSPRLHVSDLHQEWLHAVVVPPGDTSSHHDGIVRELAHRPGPKLSSLDCGAVNSELFSICVICCSCLYSGDIRSMTEFGLCIAPNDVVIVRLGHVVGFLSIAHQHFQCSLEGDNM